MLGQVNVPVRIVLDPETATSHLDHVETALTEAASRALLNARATLEKTHGVAACQHAREPVVSWSGPGLPSVTADARHRAEALVHQVLTTVQADTLPVTNLPPAGRAAVSTDADPQAGQTFVFSQGLKITARQMAQDWKTGLDDLSWQALYDLANMEEHFAGSIPAQVGVVFVLRNHRLGIRVWRFPSGDAIAGLGVRSIHTNTKVLKGGKLTVKTTAYWPQAMSTYRLRYGGSARASDQMEKAFIDNVGAEIDPARNADLVAAAKEWAARERNDGINSFLILEIDGREFLITSKSDYARDLDAELVPLVRDVPVRKKRKKQAGGGPPGKGATKRPDASRAGESDAAAGAIGPGTAGETAGSGTGDGGDAGDAGGQATGAATASSATGGRVQPRGGSLGETLQGDHIWPSAGFATKPLVCEPFMREPPADALVDDHGMLARMRFLAAALEVPECRYLGMFALNCAEVIAGRAWSIGVSSIDAATTTRVTVRPDGSGNNGFVDISPGATPDFEYLRLLGRVSRDLHAFASGVASAYRDPANAALIQPYSEGRPDVGSWVLHFLMTFREQLTSGYMYLFAETCRMLLLQQLRSSKEGIQGRLSRFEQTLAFFTDTLYILGETAVQLSTLRTAIRHARTTYATGSVRDVLSVPELMQVDEGPPVELPPPIQSISERILTVVGGASVTRKGGQLVATFQNRDWTVADLDAAIALRRGLVNRVDPMFLQVADLDQLFGSAQRDKDYLRRYLRAQLDEMLKANGAMTDKASSSFTGAFFALEASQYVRREGAKGWYGLRFELQGIHLLADQQLRPSIGDDPLYDEGISAAISRKADFDDMLSLFSGVGIIALSLLCAPLGALVTGLVVAGAGVALAVHDVREADRQLELYRALEDPELFQRWQDVQLAQLMATISIAFAVFDVVGVAGEAAHVIVGTTRQALRVAERGGVGMAVHSVGRTVRRQAVRNMTEQMIMKAARQALTQLAINEVLNLLLPEVITPILVPWMQDQAREHGTLPEVNAILATLTAQGTTQGITP